MRIRISAFILLLLAVFGSSAQQQPRVTGFFSDMHHIEGPGDLVGTEVWIVYARGRYYATVQSAGGEPDPPVVVPVEVTGARVKFTIRSALVYGDGGPAPDSVLNYEGAVTRAGFAGTINAEEHFSLKRRNSYWQ